VSDTVLRTAVQIALVNLDTCFEEGAEDLDYPDRARGELRKALEYSA